VIRWFVVNALPHQERRAEANLRRQGFDAWMPGYVRERRHARRIDRIVAALFPGYLFVRFDPDAQPWRAIDGTFGVRRLLCRDERPTPVPNRFVEDLRSTTSADGLLDAPTAPLAPGMKVRLTDGPFTDCIATILSLGAEDRIAILLDLLGREVNGSASCRQIVPAA
jgi:transcriptional antiterminator RfaH